MFTNLPNMFYLCEDGRYIINLFHVVDICLQKDDEEYGMVTMVNDSVFQLKESELDDMCKLLGVKRPRPLDGKELSGESLIVGVIEALDESEEEEE